MWEAQAGLFRFFSFGGFFRFGCLGRFVRFVRLRFSFGTIPFFGGCRRGRFVTNALGALVASGLPSDEFHFIGFLPHKSGQRRNRLTALGTVPGTLVFYESPYRIEKLLGELNEVFPAREVVLARELTKKFEEFLRGKPAELLAIAAKRSLKGEFVVLVSGAGSKGEAPPEPASGAGADSNEV